MFGVMTFVVPSHHSMWWSPVFLGMAKHLPAHEKWWMNSFIALLECGFCFTYETGCMSTHVFSHFSCSLPHPTVGEWVNSCVVLSCWLGLNHDKGYLCYNDFRKKHIVCLCFLHFFMDKLLISFLLKTVAFYFADKKMIVIT